MIGIAAGVVIDSRFKERVEVFEESDLWRLREKAGAETIVESIIAESEQIVLQGAFHIERISDALLSCGTLTGEEVKAIIAASF